MNTDELLNVLPSNIGNHMDIEFKPGQYISANDIDDDVTWVFKLIKETDKEFYHCAAVTLEDNYADIGNGWLDKEDLVNPRPSTEEEIHKFLEIAKSNSKIHDRVARRLEINKQLDIEWTDKELENFIDKLIL